VVVEEISSPVGYRIQLDGLLNQVRIGDHHIRGLAEPHRENSTVLVFVGTPGSEMVRVREVPADGTQVS
jgi:hypothetical protein